MQNNSERATMNAGTNSGTMMAYTPRVRRYERRQMDALFERLAAVPKLRKTGVLGWRKN